MNAPDPLPRDPAFSADLASNAGVRRPEVQISCARNADLSGILELQTQNLRDRIAPVWRGQRGFLSVAFEEEALSRWIVSPGIVVAHCGGIVVGYLVTTPLYDMESYATPRRVIEALRADAAIGAAIDQGRCVMFGPVCVHQSYRRLGIMSALYSAQFERQRAHYDWGITFVSVENRLSLLAHTGSLSWRAIAGMRVAGGYTPLMRSLWASARL